MKEFIAQCGRVLQMTDKPSTEAYKTTIKVAFVGLFGIGLIGFVIYAIKVVL